MPLPPNDWTGLSLSQGRYVVRSRLGEGGMGLVFRAVDRNLDADVVIKVPRRSMLDDPEFAGRFAREVRSLVKLAHPNVVKVTDVGEHDGVPYAVMQYLPGGTLEDSKRSRRDADGLSSALAALGDWLPGIAAALDFVHAKGYVHRDVKPGNILFDAHGHPFLSDFGVAKVVATRGESARGRTALTGAGLVLGTPEYMAPELIMGRPFDGRIDQYALGVTVFETLVGRRPFEAESPTAILVLQTTRQAPALQAIDPRVPPRVGDAVAKALAKDPSRRFPDCSAFAASVVEAAARTSATVRAPGSSTGTGLLPDTLRRACPVCSKDLVLPADLDEHPRRGKSFACTSCATSLAVMDDGRLVPATAPSRSCSRPSPPAQPTRRGKNPRSDTLAESRPPASVVAASTPAPGDSAGGALSETHSVAGPSPDVKFPLRAFAAGVLATALVTVAVTAFVLARLPQPPPLRSPETPKVVPLPLGALSIDGRSLPTHASVYLDGAPLPREELPGPIRLPAGPHELTVACEEFEPYRRDLTVSADQTTDLKIELKPVASRLVQTPAPAAEPAPQPLPRPDGGAASDRSLSLARKTSGARESPSPKTLPAFHFKPLTGSPPVEDQTLTDLLDDPSLFGSRVVVPVGLYVIARDATRSEDRGLTVQVRRVTFHVKGRNLAVLQAVEPPRSVSIDAELARRLADLHALRLTSRTPSATGGLGNDFGDNAAVLTFHVGKRSEGREQEWVPVLAQAEFLTLLNYWRIGEKKYKDSFRTLTVSVDEPHRAGHSLRTDWSTRMGASYLAQVRHFVHNLKDIKFANDMQRIDGAMSQALGSILRNSPDLGRMLDQQLRSRPLGR